MRFLPSQASRIFEVIDGSDFERAEFELEETNISIVRYRQRPLEYYFVVRHGSSGYDLTMVPGLLRHEEQFPVLEFNELLKHFALWLAALRRELDAEDTFLSTPNQMPAWAIDELPDEYRSTVEKVKVLQEQERKWRRMTGLLWESGEPLNRLVRDAFRATGLKAESTEPGATYDVTVTLPTGRLLVEVTGIEGNINKGSKKISQVLQAQQKEAGEGDRLAVCVNAFRQRRPAERASEPLATPEALALLKALGALVFSSSELFSLWLIALDDPDAARGRVETLMRRRAGIVRI